jgi:phage terminase large subunit
MKIQIPEKLGEVFQGKCRYRGAYGGRGSAKSRTFATMLLLDGMKEPGLILCARELQSSLKESVHAELCALIDEHNLSWFYDYGREYLRSRPGVFPENQTTEFVYSGLRHNSQGVKSKSRFRRCWVEEAEYVSEESWKDLIPTIRMPGSEIWITWNREIDGSATDKRFIKSPPKNAKIVEMNFRDNPWFPNVLEEERLNDLKRDPDAYQHIWEGQYTTRSEAQIMRGKWRVEEFEPQPHWDGPYDGADWGFSQDPTVRVRVWIEERPDGTRILYIEREAYGKQTELLDLPELFDNFPRSREVKIRGDNSRPETISYMKNAGFNIIAADKWKGSVEDGIAHMRGAYDYIVIHPRCPRTQEEFRLYSYKTDRLTKDILTDILDKNNHCVDAIRYALDPVIQRKRGFFS